MIQTAFLLAKKDLTIILSRSAGLCQALLLGLLLIFLFSLSLQTGEVLSPHSASTMFWLASIFCQVLIFQMLYAIEEQNGAKAGLQTLPCPLQTVWLGKFTAGIFLLFVSQLIFIPAVFVFLAQHLGTHYFYSLLGIFLTDVGICACGSLLGALCVGQSGKESLLSIILFPLLIPLLLSAISLSSVGLLDLQNSFVDITQIYQWLGIALAFDCIFSAVGLILFPYLYHGE
jgi:heme exporter protein B